jgi:hypothetical protein
MPEPESDPTASAVVDAPAHEVDGATGAGDDDPGPCTICGRRPAWYLEFDQNVGLLVYRHVRTWKGVACRPCGTGIGKRYLRNTLLTGWWGLVSLPANLLAVKHDLTVLRELRAEPDPT